MEPAVEAAPGPTDSESNIAGTISLVDAAEQLGVHYMTAYRYIRTGRLPATKQRGQWWVSSDDITAFSAAQSTPEPVVVSGDAAEAKSQTKGVRVSRRRYAAQLRRRLIVGDDAGAWVVVTEALASGAEPRQVHLDVIGPALEQIGEQWAAGELTISEEHQATAVVHRLLGRMTPMFRHPGRTKATVVLGVVSGDPHSLPVSLMSDLLHDRNFTVVNLGANTPAEAFVDVLNSIDGPVAVGLFAALDSSDEVMRSTVEIIRQQHPDVPLILGGPCGVRVGPLFPGVQWSTSSENATELFEEFRSVAA